MSSSQQHRTQAPEAPAPAETAPARPRARHVDELDIVRVLTFACVIGVHVVSHENGSTNVTAGGVLMILHFTREAFFWLTGFVLTLHYGRRRFNVPHFWRRRFQLVGIPYVLWSVLYVVVTLVHDPSKRSQWGSLLGKDLLFGQAWYHLYFLLVSLQIYLLFPLLAALVRATERHHLALLAVAFVLQLGILAGLKWVAPYSGWASWMNAHEAVLFWNYEFWIISGAVAARHLDDLRRWAAAHGSALAVGCTAAAVATVGYYAGERARGESVSTAYAVLQPIMLLWAAAAIAALFQVGRRYAATRERNALRQVVRVASDRSFGIFLVHPMIIWFVGMAVDPWLHTHVANPWRTALMYVLVVVGAVLATEVLRRSPVSLVLTGRPMIGRAREAA